MALVNLKRESSVDYSTPYAANMYPGGLCLYLDDDTCEALGLTKALKAGTEVSITARAIVTSSTESLEQDGDDMGNDVSLQLQITDMQTRTAGMVRNAAKELYGAD